MFSFFQILLVALGLSFSGFQANQASISNAQSNGIISSNCGGGDCWTDDTNCGGGDCWTDDTNCGGGDCWTDDTNCGGGDCWTEDN